MHTVLYFSPTHVVYETRVFDTVDIAELVNCRMLDSLASADRQFDFWFASSASGKIRPVNLDATEILLATTRFSPATVPLLRGPVVVGTHRPDGTLSGINRTQLGRLANASASLQARHERALTRRIAREDRLRQRVTATGPAQIGGTHPASS